MIESIVHEPPSGLGRLDANLTGVLDVHNDRDTRVQSARRGGFIRAIGEERDVWNVIGRCDNDGNI